MMYNTSGIDDAIREKIIHVILHTDYNEFGFDYLRDNMKYDINEIVQKIILCIVDEVGILIDEFGDCLFFIISRVELKIKGSLQVIGRIYKKIF